MVKTSNPVHFHEGQWWFWDEVGLERMGPFSTEEQANEGMEEYCVEVLGYKNRKGWKLMRKILAVLVVLAWAIGMWYLCA